MRTASSSKASRSRYVWPGTRDLLHAPDRPYAMAAEARWPIREEILSQPAGSGSAGAKRRRLVATESRQKIHRNAGGGWQTQQTHHAGRQQPEHLPRAVDLVNRRMIEDQFTRTDQIRLLQRPREHTTGELQGQRDPGVPERGGSTTARWSDVCGRRYPQVGIPVRHEPRANLRELMERMGHSSTKAGQIRLTSAAAPDRPPWVASMSALAMGGASRFPSL
jgi:hypothetical protein